MRKEITAEFGRRLKKLRLERNYTMDELCEFYNEKFDSNLNKGTLSKYENGMQEPLFTTVRNFSELFSVRIDDIIGRMENTYDEHFKKVVPVVSVIDSDSPIIKNDNIEEYAPIMDKYIDYGFKIKDDSMIGARIFSNDIVFVEKDAKIENGDIAVVLVEGKNATLRRYYKYGNSVILKPENPTMKEMEFNSKNKNFKLLGKVRYITIKI